MDIKQSLNYRYDNFNQYKVDGNNKYDYRKNGILNKVLPKILFKGNSIFVTFLQLIDLRIILLLDYIEQMQKFKYISSNV